MRENYKAIAIIALAVILIMIIVAAIICLPNCDRAVTGAWRSANMNIFGGVRW